MEHHRVIAGGVRLRAVLVWLLASGALGGLALVALPLALALPAGVGPSFADALVQVCAAAALVAATALWGTATGVALDVLRSGAGAGLRPAGPVRRLLLAACGIALVAGAAPAHAGTPDGPDGPDTPLGAAAVHGLPLPDRAVGGGPDDVVVVRRGDSLWSIAARRLGPGASAADLSSYWRRMHALNADVIGADPDLIQPGQSLRLPPA